MALKIGVDLPFDPNSPVEFEHFGQKKFQPAYWIYVFGFNV